jgi:flagellar protein FliO/FliZ
MLVASFFAPPALASEILGPGRIAQTLVTLGAVVALIFVLAYAARRMQGLQLRSAGALKIVDSVSLGTRERIVLLEIEGERVAIAVTSGRIETLHVVGGKRPAADFGRALQGAEAALEETVPCAG